MKSKQVIRNHPSALQIYQNKLLESGCITKQNIDRINNKVNAILNEEFNSSKDYIPQRRDWLSAYWAGFKSPEQISRVRNTGYDNVPLFMFRFNLISSTFPSVMHGSFLQC